MAPSKSKLPKKRAAEDEMMVAATEDAVAEILVEASASPDAKPKAKKRKGSKRDFTPEDFDSMLFQACLYRAKEGDLHVHATDEEHEDLFAWMQEQRRMFKLYQEDPASSSLTEDQIKVLDSLQFHWHTRGEEHWTRQYEALKKFQQENGHCLVPRLARDKLGDFVTEQRRQYKLLQTGKPSRMTVKRKALLDELGFVWQVRQRTGWHDRYDELIKFKEQYGDTIVPQQYEANRPLGKWVAKQREQYRLLQQGKHSFLTPDRLQALNEIGFVWHVQGPGRPGRPLAVKTEETAQATAPAVEQPADVGEAAEAVVAEAEAAAAVAGADAVAAPAEGKEGESVAL